MTRFWIVDMKHKDKAMNLGKWLVRHQNSEQKMKKKEPYQQNMLENTRKWLQTLTMIWKVDRHLLAKLSNETNWSKQRLWPLWQHGLCKSMNAVNFSTSFSLQKHIGMDGDTQSLLICLTVTGILHSCIIIIWPRRCQLLLILSQLQMYHVSGISSMRQRATVGCSDGDDEAQSCTNVQLSFSILLRETSRSACKILSNLWSIIFRPQRVVETQTTVIRTRWGQSGTTEWWEITKHDTTPLQRINE